MEFRNYCFLIVVVFYCPVALGVWQCTLDEDCASLAGSVCSGGECVCPLGTQSVLGGAACADYALYYHATCYEDFQCSRLLFNFQCEKAVNASGSEAGVCSCLPGHHYLGGRCWPSARWGEPCARDEDCMSLLRDPYSLSCQDNVCECAPGYYLRQRGECRRMAQAVGEPCVLDEDCRFEGGFCNTRLFTCDHPSESKIPESSNKMLPSPGALRNATGVRQFGVACQEECPGPFECTSSGICACPRGYYPNAAGTICLAELGSSVSSEEQCAGFFTEVRDGICTCQTNFYYDENMRTCVKAVIRLTDTCTSDVGCHTFGFFTRCGEPRVEEFGMRSCECIPEETVWTPNMNMCRLFAGVGEGCEVNSDCMAGALEIQCVANDQGQGICTCPEEYETVDGLCLQLGQGLGDSCQVTLECADTANALCAGEVCTCSNGFQQTGQICAPALQSACSLDSECVIENSACSNGTCQCVEGFVEYDATCWAVASDGFDSPCNISLQCTAAMGEGSACVAGNCSCGPTYHYTDGECWSRTGLFESCSRSSQCFLGELTERVECRNSLCQCTFDYPYSEELRTCTSSGINMVANSVAVILSLFLILRNS